eukprot:scaffold859_cov59-Phaeocystis_antarctica.AAC.1
MPSGGALSNPNDKALVTSLEDKMIEAYGTALVELKCKAAGGKKVDLSEKMLRPMHVGALFAAMKRYQVAVLDLNFNQLGAAGGELVTAALKTNTTLTTLECAQLGRPSNQVPRVSILARRAPQACNAPLHSPFSPSFAVCAASATTTSAPRLAWRSPRSSRGTRPSRRSGLLPCHRTHPPVRHGRAARTLAALALFTFLCRLHSLYANFVGPAAGMALAEALKGNTTLTSLSMQRSHALALFTFLCRLRSLANNKLGPAAGMAIAEALKSNTTLTSLESAALPSNPPARASRPHGMHARCTRPFHLPLPFAQPRAERPRPRGWHGVRQGPQGQHDPHVAHVCGPAISNPPTRASRALDMHQPFRAFHPPPHPSSDASPHRPARAVNTASHSLRVPRTSPARAQPTRGLRIHRAHGRPRANTLAAATRARTRRGPRPRPPLPTGVWHVRVHAPTCTCPSQAGAQRPRRRRRAGPQSGRRQRPRAVPLEHLGRLGDRPGNSATLGEVA